jgi:hypothetical protein
MSALPPKVDIAERDRHVRFVPKADIGQAINEAAAYLSQFSCYRSVTLVRVNFLRQSCGMAEIAQLFHLWVSGGSQTRVDCVECCQH